MSESPPRYMEVDLDQLSRGWRQKVGGVWYHREFKVVRQTDNPVPGGTYIVEMPPNTQRPEAIK